MVVAKEFVVTFPVLQYAGFALGYAFIIVESAVIRNILKPILVIASLLFSTSSAMAFTLIVLPGEEATVPSKSITDATTYVTQVQPLIRAIRGRLLNYRDQQGADTVAHYDHMLAANSYFGSASDGPLLLVAIDDSVEGVGGGDGSGKGGFWFNSAYTNIRNDFERTKFDGHTQGILAGVDYTSADKFVLGLAANFEVSQFNTDFNLGNEKTTGYTVTPYFAWLLSDNWTVDLSLGYGDFDTKQDRTFLDLTLVPLPANVAIDSEFSSTREFAAMNLTHAAGWGSWYFTQSVGVLGLTREQDEYIESDGTVVAGSRESITQWNAGAEVAYSPGGGEVFLNAIYEKTRNAPEVTFLVGEQPVNDPDSVLASTGWRYFGKTVTANFAFSTRLDQEDVTEYGVSATIYVGL